MLTEYRVPLIVAIQRSPATGAPASSKVAVAAARCAVVGVAAASTDRVALKAVLLPLARARTRLAPTAVAPSFFAAGSIAPLSADARPAATILSGSIAAWVSGSTADRSVALTV